MKPIKLLIKYSILYATILTSCCIHTMQQSANILFFLVDDQSDIAKIAQTIPTTYCSLVFHKIQNSLTTGLNGVLITLDHIQTKKDTPPILKRTSTVSSDDISYFYVYLDYKGNPNPYYQQVKFLAYIDMREESYAGALKRLEYGHAEQAMRGGASAENSSLSSKKPAEQMEEAEKSFTEIFNKSLDEVTKPNRTIIVTPETKTTFTMVKGVVTNNNKSTRRTRQMKSITLEWNTPLATIPTIVSTTTSTSNTTQPQNQSHNYITTTLSINRNILIAGGILVTIATCALKKLYNYWSLKKQQSSIMEKNNLNSANEESQKANSNKSDENNPQEPEKTSLASS